MSAVLQLENVTGGYSVRKPVIHELSFKLQPGEMVGLIGLNGAGKSTTIKHILGLLTPFSGKIRIGDKLEDERTHEKKIMAYVPESPLLYDELTVYEHLRLTAMAYGLEEPVFKQRMNELAERFQMEPHLKRLPNHLSKGMRQKVMIMNAFMADPKLYIIDEPFLGLDPLGIRSLLDLLVEKTNQGAAILMSSHILSTMEKYCDRFIVLHHGRMVGAGPLSALQQQAGEKHLEDVFYRLVQGGEKQ